MWKTEEAERAFQKPKHQDRGEMRDIGTTLKFHFTSKFIF